MLFALLLLFSSEILGVLETQKQAWNRGDLEAFMATYENSPETTYVGRQVVKGYSAILDHYKRAYPAGRMGQLDFSGLEVRPLGTDYAIVTGNFKLDTGSQGLYTLILRKTSQGWKIIHDHTTGTTPR